jgi:hypothetical protein
LTKSAAELGISEITLPIDAVHPATNTTVQKAHDQGLERDVPQTRNSVRWHANETVDLPRIDRQRRGV